MAPSRTPWKKSRTLGDIYGGRSRTKLTDNIFNRLDSLTPPGSHDTLPITIEDNPSRDFVFPSSMESLVERCRDLPGGAADGISHLWLRRISQRRFEQGVPQAEFVCGSGVRLIVIYPWPADLLLQLGPDRPSESQLRGYAPWTTDVRHARGQWFLAWQAADLDCYCQDYLLMHEIGHHLDWYRNRWTPANRRQTEARADSYAVRWPGQKSETFTP